MKILRADKISSKSYRILKFGFWLVFPLVRKCDFGQVHMRPISKIVFSTSSCHNLYKQEMTFENIFHFWNRSTGFKIILILKKDKNDWIVSHFPLARVRPRNSLYNVESVCGKNDFVLKMLFLTFKHFSMVFWNFEIFHLKFWKLFETISNF